MKKYLAMLKISNGLIIISITIFILIKAFGDGWIPSNNIFLSFIVSLIFVLFINSTIIPGGVWMVFSGISDLLDSQFIIMRANNLNVTVNKQGEE